MVSKIQLICGFLFDPPFSLRFVGREQLTPLSFISAILAVVLRTLCKLIWDSFGGLNPESQLFSFLIRLDARLGGHSADHFGDCPDHLVASFDGCCSRDHSVDRHGYFAGRCSQSYFLGKAPDCYYYSGYSDYCDHSHFGIVVENFFHPDNRYFRCFR